MHKYKTLFFLLTLGFLTSCGGSSEKSDEHEKLFKDPPPEAVAADPMNNLGIGPISSIELGEISDELVAQGKTVFDEKCTACHKADKKYIGPSPVGIMNRRSPEWIMNMILNPEEMTQKDPIAKRLLAEANGAPMANQNLTQEEARAILEYFRTL